MPTQKVRGLLVHGLMWGLGLGVAASLAVQILTWFGLGLSHLTWISTWLLVVIFAALGGRSLGRRLVERPRFLQAVAMVVVMVLVSRLIYQTYMFVYINHVDPTWCDTVAQVWTEQLREAGTPQAEIESQIASFRELWETKNIFTIGLIGFTLPQLILGWISVLFAAVQPWKRTAATLEKATMVD